jgi:hypothetical protein
MAAVGGLRGTGDWGTDERPKDFRESIMRIRPNGTSPIFGLTSKAKKTVKTDPEFAWWAEGETLVRLQVNGALASTDTTVVVDSVDPTVTTLGANYGLATHLKQGDLLLVEPAADNATYDHEIIMVQEVMSATAFTVSRGAGGTTAATIANDLYLTLIGSAYAEGTGIPKAVSRNPIKFYNYTQIFKDVYELTKTADVTKTRTGDTWSNDKKRKAFDHARSIEHAILFGTRSETTGSNGKPLRTMGGLRTFIPASNTTVFGAAVTINSLITALSPCFDYSTDAGDTRLAFGGNYALMEINKVVSANSSIHVNYDKKITMYGLDFTEIVLPRGRVLFYSHPLLNVNSLYKKSMFVLDYSNLSYVTLSGRDTKATDDVQTKDEDVRRGYYQTECSLLVDSGGLSMAYLGNISAT